MSKEKIIFNICLILSSFTCQWCSLRLLGQEKLNITFLQMRNSISLSQVFIRSLSKFHTNLFIQFGPLLTWSSLFYFIFRWSLQNIIWLSKPFVWIQFAEERTPEICVSIVASRSVAGTFSAGNHSESLNCGRVQPNTFLELHFHFESVTTPSANEPIILAVPSLACAIMATTLDSWGMVKLIGKLSEQSTSPNRTISFLIALLPSA